MITKLEDSENHRNAFEISGDRHKLCGHRLSWEATQYEGQCVAGCALRGVVSVAGCGHAQCAAPGPMSAPQLHFSLCPAGSMIERILVSCNNQQDLHEWVDHLQKQTKVTSVSNPTIKPHSIPSHTVRAPGAAGQHLQGQLPGPFGCSTFACSGLGWELGDSHMSVHDLELYLL